MVLIVETFPYAVYKLLRVASHCATFDFKNNEVGGLCRVREWHLYKYTRGPTGHECRRPVPRFIVAKHIHWCGRKKVWHDFSADSNRHIN